MKPVSRATYNVNIVNDILKNMGVVLAAGDVRLIARHLKHDYITESVVNRKLIELAHKTATDPEGMLATKGVGKKTFGALCRFSRYVITNDTRKHFGVAENLSAINVICNGINRGANKEIRELLEQIKKLVGKAEMIEFELAAKSQIKNFEKGKVKNETKQNSSKVR